MFPPAPFRIAALGVALSVAAPLVAVAANKPAPTITVDNAWFATLPNDGPTYGYFRITNTGSVPKLITDFSAPPCSSLKLEEAHSGGTNSKAAVQMTVAAKDTLAFSRGGYHLVCRRSGNAPSPGQTVPVTITLNGGVTLRVDFAVRTFPH